MDSYAKLWTPLLAEQRRTFSGLDYYAYNPSWRLIGRLDEKVERETFAVELRDDGIFRYTRVGRAHLTIQGEEAALSVFWIEGSLMVSLCPF